MVRRIKSGVLAAAVCVLFCGTAGTPRQGNDPLPKDAFAQAEKAARTVLGAHVPLISAQTGGGFLFTCRNGYALVDPVSGTVLEYALSDRDAGPVVSRPAETATDPTK